MESLIGGTEALIIGVGLDLPPEEVEKLVGATDGVAAGMEERLKGANAGLMNLGKRSTQGTRALTGLASAVSLVDPRLGQMIRSVATLGRGLQVMRLGMGPAAVAIGALSAAMALHAKQQAELDARRELSERITVAMAAAQKRLTTAYETLAIATGDLSSEEAKILQVRRQAFTESLPAVQDMIKAITSQSLRLEEAKNALDNLNPKQRNFIELQELAIRGVQQEGNALTQLEERRSALAETLRETVKVEIEAIKVTESKTRATKAAKKEEKLRAEQLRELEGMLKTVAGIESAATQSIESDEERIVRVYQERIDALDEVAQKTQDSIDTTAARGSAEMAMEEELYQLRQRNREAMEASREQAHSKEMARIQEELSARTAMVSDLGTAMGSLSSIAEQAAQDRTESDRKAAERALGISKALAFAEATAAFGVGMMNAIARNAGRPLATVLSTAAVGTAYATQTQAISKATLHRGGMADEIPATLTRREAVLNPLARQTIGDDAIRRAQAGQAPRQDRTIVVDRYRHQTYNRFMRDNLEMGSPVSKAINGSQSVGRRSSRKGR